MKLGLLLLERVYIINNLTTLIWMLLRQNNGSDSWLQLTAFDKGIQEKNKVWEKNIQFSRRI